VPSWYSVDLLLGRCRSFEHVQVEEAVQAGAGVGAVLYRTFWNLEPASLSEGARPVPTSRAARPGLIEFAGFWAEADSLAQTPDAQADET